MGPRISAAEITPEQRVELISMRYATKEWAQTPAARYLLIGSDGVCSLLVNEEDHLRLQTLLPGFQVEECLASTQPELQRLSQSLRFAWKDTIGYVTASPVNAGTGMRLSVLVQLMALAQVGTLNQTLRAAEALGSSVRGVYGEHTQPTGALFQVSNGLAHGTNMERWTARVSATAHYLVEAERRARAELYGSRPARLRLKRQAERALELLFESEVSTTTLLWIASILRLAACENVLPVDRREAAAWVAIAGMGWDAASKDHIAPEAARFDAVRRSAALRARIRASARGTLPTTNAGLSGRTDMDIEPLRGD